MRDVRCTFQPHEQRPTCCLLWWRTQCSPYPTTLKPRVFLLAWRRDEMSRNHGKNPKVDLKLNPSAKQVRARGGPSTRAVVVSEDEDDSSSSPSVSPPSSCVSSEEEQKQADSPEATSSMVLAGCPRCLMYVMLSEKDPKCPKCKSTVLVDFHRGSTSSRRSRRS